MSDDMPVLEGEDYPVYQSEDIAAAAAEAEEAPKRRWAVPDDAERRRKKVNVHWKRPKSHLYEYNYDYRANYYKGMIDYLDGKSYGYRPVELPKPLTWAERALRTYAEKREAAVFTKTNKDVELLHKIRSSANEYELRSKNYYNARKAITSMYL